MSSPKCTNSFMRLDGGTASCMCVPTNASCWDEPLLASRLTGRVWARLDAVSAPFRSMQAQPAGFLRGPAWTEWGTGRATVPAESTSWDWPRRSLPLNPLVDTLYVYSTSTSECGSVLLNSSVVMSLDLYSLSSHSSQCSCTSCGSILLNSRILLVLPASASLSNLPPPAAPCFHPRHRSFMLTRCAHCRLPSCIA